jgi:hypothetical protein
VDVVRDALMLRLVITVGALFVLGVAALFASEMLHD